jgi:hypothetical protein
MTLERQTHGIESLCEQRTLALEQQVSGGVPRCVGIKQARGSAPSIRPIKIPREPADSATSDMTTLYMN